MPLHSKNKVKSTVIALMFIALIISLGWLGIETVEHQLKNNLGQQLNSSLNSTLETLHLWAQDTSIDAQILTNEPTTKGHLLNLLEFEASKQVTAEALSNNPHLIWLKKYLGVACAKYGFVGFVLFDPNGFQVGTLLDKPFASKELKNRSGFFQRSIQGETVFSHPFPSEVPLPHLNGGPPSIQPTMFVSTPVYDSNSEIAGVLAFRIRPEFELARLMSVGRIGRTGETYLFDKQGILLSPSRFDEKLKEIGLLSPEESSLLNIRLRAPKEDLTGQTAYTPDQIAQWPLTLMARSAISKNKGNNLDGYRSYRGVSVVGSWTWIPEFDLGMATEIEINEAFSPIETLVNWFLGLASLLLLSCIIAWALELRNESVRKEADRHATRLNTIMNSLQDPIIAINDKGIILTASPAVKNQFYYNPEELIGQNVKLIVPEPHHSKHDEYIQNYLKTGQAKIINMVRTLEGLRKDGSTFPMELRVTEVITDGQSYFTGIIRDITERRLSEEKLREANLFLEKRIEQRTQELKKTTRDAERSNAAKSEFLSRMSHELRTPMNAILGFSQLVYASKTEPLTDNQKSRMDQIIKAGRHLLELINEVLDLATIESGKITISPEPVSLGDLMDEIHSITLPVSEQYNIDLINKVDQDNTLYVVADKIRLKQVLLNLISNGIKYNRPGGSVVLSTLEHPPDHLRIEVRDTGMGIPPDKLEKVFEPFDRLGADKNEIEGTGIGMTISRKLMELMKGTLEVESTVGQGSSFYVTLPKSAVPRSYPKIQEKLQGFSLETSSDEGHTHSLLYIEDNPANLKLVEEILHERPSIKFLSAALPHLGLELARAHRPSLILLDINLPEMDGFKVLKHLQNYEETHNIPVIALSANAMLKDIQRGLDKGFQAYLTKPIDMLRLLSVIDEYLKSDPNQKIPAITPSIPSKNTEKDKK